MSGDMQNWRPLLSTAANKLHSFKGYLVSKDPRPLTPASSSGPYQGEANPSSSDPGPTTRQSWTQWAGGRLRRSQGDDASVVEKVSLFPGWAARRLDSSSGEVTQFNVEISVSGFASRLNSPEFMSRSQKAFLGLAKRFVSLPKPQDEADFTQLSPPLYEMAETKEMQNLEEQFRNLNSDFDTPPSDSPSVAGTPLRRSPSNSSKTSSSPAIPPAEGTFSMASRIQELNANLEQRLMPFWSSALSNRIVRVSLFISEEAISIVQALGKESYELDHRLRPLDSRKVTTAQDGSFQIKFGIPWNVLCTHPDGVRIAFGDATTEYDFFVLAELLPPRPPSPSSGVQQQPSVNNTSVSKTQIKIPLSHTPLRVISDIDDTVKMANVLAGARAIFYTVFVQNLADIVIPGMGDWYTRMWQRGARFHYVSNGPFEILPILTEFFPLAKLPPGSIKLRSYAGRSLFNGFLSAPAARKRQGVIDILNSFPESQFILVGDSGEQDMELYATVAMERPHQILAVFIRDARSPSDGENPPPIEDPLGASAKLRLNNCSRRSGSRKSPRRSSTTSSFNNVISAQPVMSPGPTPLYQTQRQPSTPYNKPQGSVDYFGQPSIPGNFDDGSVSWPSTPQIRGESTVGETDISMGLGSKPPKMSDTEWKRLELQMRVDRARTYIPPGVRFRLFVNPEECVEAFEVLDQFNKLVNV